MASLAGLLLLLASAVVANNCTIQPVYVDFHNRAVDGGITFQYGLFTGIGSPISQNLSQWPSLSNNETSVGSLDYCSTSPFQTCVNQSHGFYSPALSQTYSSASTYKGLDSLGSIPATVLETAYDTYNLFTHYFDPSPPNLTTISQFPLTVLSNYSANASPWFGPAGLLGLGPSSVLLQRLYDMDLISSRSFGLYMGTAYQQANGVINGSLTLGGYDSGRFGGDVYNYTISSANSDGAHSPFKVTIAQMTLTTADGNTTELSNQFDAYITTSQYALNLPSAVTQQFADVTGATPSIDGLDVLQLPSGFDATLTITLAGGFNVTYDAQWLRNVSNNSPISAAPISSNATSSQTNLLGTAFLSSVYFMANYDSHPPNFQLASALADAQYVQTQTLCPDTVPTPASTTNIPSFTRAGLTGAIIGGVVGGMGLTFLSWYCLRRCYQRRERRRLEAQARNQDLDGTISVRPKSDGSNRDSSEMTTFAFDFNSSTHQAYQNYLRSKSHGHDGQRPLRSPPLQLQQQRQQQYRSSSADSLTGSATRAQEYLRSVDDAYMNAPPITPATGVPLLQSQQEPARSSIHTRTPIASSFMQAQPQEQPQSQSYLFPSNTDAPSTRTSHESARRQEYGLNVQTEFAPPPKMAAQTKKSSSKSDKLAPKALRNGGKKESMLRKVFPPPGS
ncbi:hypothetical protein LTR10_021154 [Elasticomyces elasticus]|uniref:Peptidase A1 domain-containing protein n=1 Tax=Exophiala sideris TaxID=1016849 RepID=A0ABR0JNZ7_9EURO|nr:hypothetical protein LTR10_021154 [Elasticomyces elasticus]KAK5038214.1 hypothetical protein LTS07_001683 [Exophiala sideris]KAK5044198.1 hypothetical protein LTR13_000554 [Exophiala sideris]KAK5067698.1 hypothetical protein LTR69_001687 [Exophiala sideris]KAK5184061.1 hypothetical protein LTR44_003567 [Eurotiomycetes sp. CCFEE 6388]